MSPYIPQLLLQPSLVFLLGVFLTPLFNRVLAHLSEEGPLWGGEMRCGACGRVRPWVEEMPLAPQFLGLSRCQHPAFPWPFLTLVVIALGGGLLALGHGVAGGKTASWPVISQSLMFFYLLYLLAVADIRTFSVEPLLVLAGVVVRFGYLGIFQPGAFFPMLMGMLSGAGLFALVALFYRGIRGRDGLGEGDWAVLGLIGAFVGWQGILPVVALASVSALVAGVGLVLLRVRTLEDPLAFVPYLCLGGLGVYFLRVFMPSLPWLSGFFIQG